METTPTRFEAAIAAMDAENARDPNRYAERPYELVYAERLTEWTHRLDPHPSEALLLAIRGLHIGRWTVPRHTYPMTKQGYTRWKNALRVIHADRVSAILQEVGYDAPTIERVRELILRSTFPDDPESRVVEDAVSLLFLEMQFAAFSAKTERQKLIRILRKVWKRLTPQAQTLALSLHFEDAEHALIAEALNLEDAESSDADAD